MSPQRLRMQRRNRPNSLSILITLHSRRVSIWTKSSWRHTTRCLSAMTILFRWLHSFKKIPGTLPKRYVCETCNSGAHSHFQNFIPKLQDHLLNRILERKFDGDEEDFTDKDRNTIRIANRKIYTVKTLRVNYTTYDVRRDSDLINPRTDYCNIMVRSPETHTGAHPYWYAQVMGIFHAQVMHVDPRCSQQSSQPQHMEFLWVRWLGTEPGYRSGSRYAKLPKIGFVPDTDDMAFGFLNPSLIIRACHLIPDFNGEKTPDLLRAPTSVARRPGEDEDWCNFYVNT